MVAVDGARRRPTSTHWSPRPPTILDDAAKPFIEGHRADSAVQKKGNDFATEVDLAIERQVVEALTRETGIGVHGEEFGGADSIRRWCGCSTRSTAPSTTRPALPMAAILLGLLRDGEPVAGLTWLPFTGERFTGVVGKPLRSNGVEQPHVATGETRRIDRRGQHVQRRLARQVPGPVPARGDRGA